MSNGNKKKFSDSDEFDELLENNRKKNINIPDTLNPAPDSEMNTKILNRTPDRPKPNTPSQAKPPANNRQPQVMSDKNIVTDAKLREGFQKERADIFNKLKNDEQYINRHRTPQKKADDGSYRYVGKDIKSNRQRLVDVQPKSKTKSTAEVGGDITVKNKKRQRYDAESDEYVEKSGFFLSGLMKAILYIIAVAAVSVILALNIIDIANDVFAFVKTDMPVSVNIPEDAELSDIVDILYENNLIKYPRIFEIYIRDLRKRSGDYVGGIYLLNSNMNYDDFIDVIRKRTSAFDSIRLTIPEGFTIDEIIDIFLENGIGTRENFIDIINNYPFDYTFVRLLDEAELSPHRKYRLEGYLFPDTYDFFLNSTELQVIDRFLRNFNNKFSEDFYLACDMIGMTVDDVINLASIIEREARFLSDFSYVSSVFHNRLLSPAFPRLEANATIQYSLGGHRSELLWMSEEDIALDVPYNTYIYAGLPPSAICNPGYEAIYAALEPEFTDYYYFVSRNNGYMLYGRNSSEHANNIYTARNEVFDE